MKQIKETSSTKEKEQLIIPLIMILNEKHILNDAKIYCCNKCYCTRFSKSASKLPMELGKKRVDIYVTDNICASDCIDFANDNLVTIVFDGEQYHHITYESNCIAQTLNQFFSKYGLYCERGYVWSLTTYELPF